MRQNLSSQKLKEISEKKYEGGIVNEFRYIKYSGIPR